MDNLNIGTILFMLVVFVGIVAVVINFAKVKKFVSEVTVELKKVSWSTRQEVLDATWIVGISSVCLGLFIGGTDFVLSKCLELIIR